MITILIHLIVVLLVLGVLWWITTLFPLPHPFPLAIQVLFVLVGAIAVIDALLGLSGVASSAPLWWR